MAKFTMQASGLSGYNRRSVEASSPDQAVIFDHKDLVEDWGTRVPFDVEVFIGRGEKIEYSAQDIIDLVAEYFNLPRYIASNLACFG